MSVPTTEMAKAISYVSQLARKLADTLLKFYKMAFAIPGRLRSSKPDEVRSWVA